MITALRRTFGGTWDGPDREIWGLVERDGQNLKIELLRSSEWVCSVFRDGSCVAQARACNPVAAVEAALTAVGSLE